MRSSQPLPRQPRDGRPRQARDGLFTHFWGRYQSEQGKGATWYLHELWHGDFRRSVTLPFEVDAAKAEATFENGIVRIALPKAERAKPYRIEVRTASGQGEAIEAGSTKS